MNVHVGAPAGNNQDEDYKKIVKLLEPILRAAAEHMSATRVASSISDADLKAVRVRLAVKLGLDEQITTLLGARPTEEGNFWCVSWVNVCNVQLSTFGCKYC